MTNREAIKVIEWIKNTHPEQITCEALTLAIAALEQQEKAYDEWCPDCKEYDKEKHCCHRFTKVIRQTVEECKKEWPDSKWYPVKEKLPEDYEHVLVSGEKVVKQAQFIKGMFEMEDGEGYATINSDNIDEPHFYTFKAIAWMPLPEPYQGDET